MDIGAVFLKIGQAPAKGVKRLLYALVLLVTASVSVVKQKTLLDILFISVINTYFVRIAFYDLQYRIIKNGDLLLLLFIKSICLGMQWIFGTNIVFDMLECLILAVVTMLLCLTVRSFGNGKDFFFGDGDFKYLIVLSFCMGMSGFALAMLLTLIISVVFCLVFPEYRTEKSLPAAPILSFGAIIGILVVG